MRIFVLTIAALWSSVAGGPQHDEVLAASAGLAPSVPDPCVACLEVVGGESCPTDWHYAWDGDDEAWTRNGGAHLDGLCRSGTCDTTHGPYCEATVPAHELRALQTAAASHDVSTVANALASYPKQITLNVTRSALQVIDCDSAVVLHAPLRSDVVASLIGAPAPPAVGSRQ
jgi:hypothetical protein